MSRQGDSLMALLTEVRRCVVCAESLPNVPNPIVQAGPKASIVIIGQAPGHKVDQSGVPWDDPSGDTLRGWLGLSDVQFYDPDLVALVPMGFCYPGRGRSGDNPPRPECAPLWHDAILGHLPERHLKIIIGSYAQARYLPRRASTLTATVADWESYLPDVIPLPHPSPRNRPWLVRNPWFEQETLPALKARVQQAVGDSGQ